MSISKADLEPIIIAAWFHDVGYIKTYQGHEAEGAEMAKEFLTREKCESEMIKVVASCINATRVPQQPNSLQSQILCDADLYHLGSLDYFYWQTLLRREWKIALQKDFTNRNWYELNMQFLLNHQFHSSYGKEKLKPMMKENIARIERILLTYC